MAVVKEQAEVQPMLASIGVNREQLLEIVKMAIRARGDATPADPTFTPGMLSYIYGTRGLRVELGRHGWEPCRTDNIESVYNPATGVKIVFQNAELAGDPLRDPIAISKKGPAAERAVEIGQYEMFPAIRHAEIRKRTAAHWYLFVQAAVIESLDGTINQDVRAELSFPKAIEDEEFSGFNHRIILLQKGEWDGIDLSDDRGGPDLDFDVDVTRKR